LNRLSRLVIQNDVVAHFVVRCRSCSGGGQDDSHDKAIKSQSLGENQDEDHADIDVFLSVCAYTGVTDNSNAKSSSECREATAESASEMFVSVEVGVFGLDGPAAHGRGLSVDDY